LICAARLDTTLELDSNAALAERANDVDPPSKPIERSAPRCSIGATPRAAAPRTAATSTPSRAPIHMSSSAPTLP
jgi:hypothetical protein